MLLLSIVICVAGVLASVLPDLPAGLTSWAILFAISLVYPLLLQPTLRFNRADYEFRLLHWFPAGIFALWAVLEIFGPRYQFMHILQLGFLFLWSLPLVALGIAFLIIFSVHVIRRSRLRVTFLSLFLAAFTVGAVFAEAKGFNPRLQAVLFEGQTERFASLERQALGIAGLFQNNPSGSSESSVFSLVSSSAASTALISSSSSSLIKPVSVIPTKTLPLKPKHLPRSGPETAAIFIVTLIGLYTSTLHKRAKARI